MKDAFSSGGVGSKCSGGFSFPIKHGPGIVPNVDVDTRESTKGRGERKKRKIAQRC
jgi:hypothetical protein